MLRYNPDVLGTVEDGMYRGADRLGWLNPGTQRHMMEAAGINPLQGGLLLEVLKNNPELLRDPVVLKAIASMMGMSTPDTRIDSYTLADVLKVRNKQQSGTIRPLGYERVYLPLCKVADTPFHIQGDKLSAEHVFKLNDY